MKFVSGGRGLNSPEFYRRRARRRRIWSILISLCFLIAISLLVYASRLEQFLISEVVISQGDIVASETLSSSIQKKLSEKYLWLVPKANAFIFPRSSIEEGLYKEFPRLESVALNLEGFRTLSVEVKERKPSAIYCAGDSECFFLDKDGLIFAYAPSFTDGVYFVYSSNEVIENPLGKNFLPTEEFERLSKFVKSLETIGIVSTELGITTYGYELTLVAGGKILWNKDSSPNLIYANLEAFLNNSAIKSEPNFLGRISQLDLRTENKVFYRFK